jgi:hypothetical protein
MPLSASGVDPRDQTWEADAPDYRVYFHDLNGAADEWELKGCDVDDAKDWAASTRPAERSSSTPWFEAPASWAWSGCLVRTRMRAETKAARQPRLAELVPDLPI